MKPMLIRTLFVLLFVSFFNSPSFAVGDFVIKNATVYTMTQEKPLMNTSILVRDGKVHAIGEDVDINGVKRVLDARSRIVTPGIMAVRSRLGIVEVGSVSATRDFSTQNQAQSASFSVTDAINPRSTLIPHNRLNGITRAVSLPEATHHVIAGQGAIFHLGSERDFIVKRDAVLGVNLNDKGAQLAGGARGSAFHQFQVAVDDTLDFIRFESAMEAGNRREYSMSYHDLKAFSPFVLGKGEIVIDVNRANDILTVIRYAQKMDLNIILNGAAEGWMVAKEIASAQIPVIVDAMANLPSSFSSLASRLDNAALLERAGVTVLFVSSQHTHNAYLVRQTAGNAVANGFPYEKALSSLTLQAAKVFGIEDTYGSIALGKDADLVIWDGDPLEVTTHPDHVFIKGIEQPLVSRATRLRERYRDLKSVKSAAYNH